MSYNKSQRGRERVFLMKTTDVMKNFNMSFEQAKVFQRKCFYRFEKEKIMHDKRVKASMSFQHQ